MSFVVCRKQKLQAQKKEDPLLRVATVDLSQATFNKDLALCHGNNHYHHKIPRGDYNYRQQATPLMASDNGDQETVIRNPDGSCPPSYEGDWAALTRTALPSEVEHSLSHTRPQKKEIPLPDLPVYFELDPHNTNTKDMMANSAHAMALRAAQQVDLGLESRYSA